MNASAQQEKEGGTRQYLTFTLGNEIFGMDVIKMREVVESAAVVTVLQAPQFIRGVMNLRGCVLPVLDVRLHYGANAASTTAGACVVVVEMLVAGQILTLGILADAVREVLDLSPERDKVASRHERKADTLHFRGQRLTTS